MKKLSVFILAMAAIAVSCSKDPFDNNPVKPDKVTDAVYFASSLPPVIDKALRMNLGQITTNPDNARVIVVESSDLSAYSDIVKEAWEDGKIIVEVEPDCSSHEEFWTAIDAPSLMSPDNADTPLLIAVRGYSSFILHNPLSLDEYLSDNEVEPEPGTASDEAWEVELGPVGIESDEEYLGSRMSSFVDWVNEHSQPASPVNEEISGYQKFNGELSSFISDEKYTQRITASFPVGADKFKLCKLASSDPDIISRHSEVNVLITITPLYAYKENGSNAGDYYFVTVSVISKNEKLFGTYKQKHGGVWTIAHAFYSEDIHWTADICKRNGKGIKVADFMDKQRPSPASTSGSTTYTSSHTTTLNVTGQGGASGGKPAGTLTVGGTFSWSNSESRPMSDMSIEMDTDGSRVQYHFLSHNFSHNDNARKAVPALARTDQECISSWCWHVVDVEDYDTTEFLFTFHLDPLYGYMYRHTSWWGEGHDRHGVQLLPEDKRDWTFAIKRPDRRRLGILDFKCTDSLYVSNVQVINGAGEVKASALSAYERNVHLNFQLPVGNYKIEYYAKNGNSGSGKGKKYRIGNLTVSTAKTTETFSGKGAEVKE
ncbi:MAG: hypothetical protein ACI3ZP_09145 [Candidatus Cryptobacteroides sp.]